jgi:hypothetical protein
MRSWHMVLAKVFLLANFGATLLCHDEYSFERDIVKWESTAV